MLTESMEKKRTNAVDLLNTFLRSVLSTGRIAPPEGVDEIFPEIFAIAKAQEVLLPLCYGLKKTGSILPEDVKKEMLAGVYQHTRNEYMLGKAKTLLQAAKIPFVPMKGALINELYPEPWTRFSCDVDLLIREEDLEKAVRILTEAGFQSENKKEYHDVSLYYAGAHLELHFNICENIPRIDGTLSKVWKHTVKISNYEYHETDAFFLFHATAHLLYHFVRGGCCLKQFLDIWLLRRKGAYNEKELMRLLSSSKLEQFYKVICEISDIWFDGKEPTELSRKIEAQVINRGLLGTGEHPDAIDITLGGGIGKHILKSVFLPMREMKWIYPALEKHPFLLPHYYWKRIVQKTIGKDRNRAQDIIKAERNKKSDDITLLKDMGL